MKNDDSLNNNDVIITQHNSINATKLASIDELYITKQFNSFIDIRFLGPKARYSNNYGHRGAKLRSPRHEVPSGQC